VLSLDEIRDEEKKVKHLKYEQIIISGKINQALLFASSMLKQ
jgi:hypothetical protein